jgi:carboxylesterase type B
VPPESWDGVKNATVDGFACPQPEADTTIPTSEDCLFLNVYTTEVISAKTV